MTALFLVFMIAFSFMDQAGQVGGRACVVRPALAAAIAAKGLITSLNARGSICDVSGISVFFLSGWSAVSTCASKARLVWVVNVAAFSRNFPKICNDIWIDVFI